MAIVNRDLDVSQQKDVFSMALGAVATTTTKQLIIVPYPCALQGVQSMALGVSNAMQVAFQAVRFTSAGQTAINLGISNLVLVNYGTSGPQGFSGLAAVGSTLLNLQSGDVLQVVTSVANGNATDLTLNLVLKKQQDIVSHNGNAL